MPDQADKLNIWALVNSRSAREITQFRRQFTNANPFPHMVVDNFFTPEFLRNVERDFPVKGENYNRYCIEDGGHIGTNYANGDVTQFPPAFKQLDALIQSKAFLNYISALTGIRDLEYDPNYFGGGIRESSSGTFLPPHVDFNYNARTHSHRRMNLLFYFNQEWHESWGGNLQVHKDPNVFSDNNSLVHSYLPSNNRCLVFETSETSWHGFDRLNLPEGKSRRAFTIYYYTKHRPDEADIRFRNTEYVEPPLPPHLGPGYTLTKADVDLLKEYLMRRDGRIRMLYDMASEVDALRVEMDALRMENDAKLQHIWSEYEYYLNLSRTTSRTKALLVAGDQAVRRLKGALRGLGDEIEAAWTHLSPPLPSTRRLRPHLSTALPIPGLLAAWASSKTMEAEKPSNCYDYVSKRRRCRQGVSPTVTFSLWTEALGQTAGSRPNSC